MSLGRSNPATGAGIGDTRALTAHECRSMLARSTEGLLSYQTGRGPRALPVRYAVGADQVIFRLPDYNDASHYAPGQQVSLEVRGPVGHHRGPGHVTVSGRARILEQDEQPTPAAGLEQWPSGVSTRVLALPLSVVAGIERALPRTTS